jgi:hypothetical protein
MMVMPVIPTTKEAGGWRSEACPDMTPYLKNKLKSKRTGSVTQSGRAPAQQALSLIQTERERDWCTRMTNTRTYTFESNRFLIDTSTAHMMKPNKETQ